MAFLPWGPMAQARKANEAVEKIAAERGVSTAVVSLAWLLRRSLVTLPIPGTSNVKHLEENVSAAAFRLTDAEFAELAAVVPKPYWLRG
jgi:aryl-alcohol dehydrogenase-like predicted oxidoreductase